MTDPQTLLFPRDGGAPLKLLVYPGTLPCDAAAIEAILAANQWPPAWRDGVFAMHHFHANAHEALGIARGAVTVRFGGPDGRDLSVAAGDLVVIPAGLSHCNHDQTPDLLIVGAYPAGSPAPDLHQESPAAQAKAAPMIAAVPLPEADPLHGASGPLTRLWGAP